MTKRMSRPAGVVTSAHSTCVSCGASYDGGLCPPKCSCGSTDFEHYADIVMGASELADPEREAFLVLQREVEELRRENARLRESAKEDFDAANNWRRYVASVGQEKASLYLVPPSKEDGH